MIRPRAWALAALAAALLLPAACGKAEAPKADAAAEREAAARHARQGPYGTQLKALDQAKALGAEVDRKTREEIEKAEQ